MLRANLRSSLVLKNRPERLSSTVQKKAPLTGAPRPAGIDGLKFDKVNVEEIQQRFESVEESLRHIKAASTSENQPDAGNNCHMSTSITFFKTKIRKCSALDSGFLLLYFPLDFSMLVLTSWLLIK